MEDEKLRGPAELRAEIAPEDAIFEAEWLFLSYIKDLREHCQVLDARGKAVLDPEELKRAVDGARTVRQAINNLFTERAKVDKLRRTIAGCAGGELDLDAARDEIGRRLACLRRTGGGE